jgi:hypothetical protein
MGGTLRNISYAGLKSGQIGKHASALKANLPFAGPTADDHLLVVLFRRHSDRRARNLAGLRLKLTSSTAGMPLNRFVNPQISSIKPPHPINGLWVSGV